MITAENLKHSYKDRVVLQGVSFFVSQNEIFGLLGPNGSGKTTLFRILATAFSPNEGHFKLAGLEIPGKEPAVREKIGVVFQSPSLDGKLTVQENLIHHGHLYGIAGQELKTRCQEMLERLGLSDRAKEKVDKLSGGLKRRVELAKALLHRPPVLILDEPSTGLDPGARIDLWRYLKKLRQENQVTILVTTHLMDEAEHCDRIAILNHGQIVTLGRPEDLKRKIHGDVIEVKTPEPERLAAGMKERFGITAAVLEGAIQMEHDKGAEFIAKFAGAFSEQIQSITYRKPTLEDVFLHETGHRFWQDGAKHE